MIQPRACLTCRASIEKYLLEKSRIISQAPGERYVQCVLPIAIFVYTVKQECMASGKLAYCKTWNSGCTFLDEIISLQ